MATDPVEPHSHLFSVRLWPEAVDGMAIEWRGKVQHIASGHTRYLRDWTVLLNLLLAMLAQEEGAAEVIGPAGHSHRPEGPPAEYAP